MKNIHLLPTEKPSSVYAKNAKLKLSSSTIAMDWYISEGYKPQHIYITSDEEIKEGDWLIVNDEDVMQMKSFYDNDMNGEDIWVGDSLNGYATYKDNCKKIILTTDQDLIADDVQAISDEFLKWFVENPTCEEVKTRKIGNEWIYNADVPQEEPNPFELPKALPDDVFYQSLEPKQETLTYTEAAKKEERIFNSTMMSKQETLEEAANRLFYTVGNEGISSIDSFMKGASYQAERMYSKEDLREAFRQGENNVGYNSKYGYIFKLTEKEWFEQFKKK